MEYKVIALDIDGTLTNSQKKITEDTRHTLMEFQKNGGKILLASGRPVTGIKPYAEILKLKEYGGYILAYNGGCVIDCKTGDIVFQQIMPREVIPEICRIIRDYPVGINSYEGDSIVAGGQINAYTELEAAINKMPLKCVENFAEYVDFDINKLLLHGEPEHILRLEAVLGEKYQDILSVFRSEAFFLEIVPKGIDKALSIDRLLTMIGFDREECIACGDGFNDISMIRYAGLGVAMSNAKDPVRQAADYVTLSNDEDGIAHLLHRLNRNNRRRRALVKA